MKTCQFCDNPPLPPDGICLECQQAYARFNPTMFYDNDAPEITAKEFAKATAGRSLHNPMGWRERLKNLFCENGRVKNRIASAARRVG